MSKKPQPSKSAPPPNAFHFAAEVVPIAPAAEGEKKRTFSGVAYSGNRIIHDWWGPLVFDLSTTKAAAKIPTLILHDRNQRAGFSGLEVADNRLAIRDGVLLDNDHGQRIAEESDQGFPWQLSVHVVPGRIEELAVGATATVNGQSVQGPCLIWRDNTIREVSFTPTGVDNDTTAIAASLGTFAGSQSPGASQEVPGMTLEEALAENKQFSTQIATMKTEGAQLAADLTAAKADATAQKTRADEAEAKLAAQVKERRTAEVKQLFSDVGIAYTEEAAAPYVAMDGAAFSAVAANLKDLKQPPPGHLFHAQATDGIDPNGEAAAVERLSKL